MPENPVTFDKITNYILTLSNGNNVFAYYSELADDVADRMVEDVITKIAEVNKENHTDDYVPTYTMVLSNVLGIGPEAE